MKTLQVNLGCRSYPIYIGEKLLESDLLSAHIHGQQVFVVTNETVGPLYLASLMKRFETEQCDHIILPDGEAHKTLSSLSLIFDELLRQKHRRNTTLIALGGGVIGDLTGFAAACYQRGVSFIQVPTTLLAAVDASIGGKTGVNHPLGKNMIGAFHQPRAVMIDITTFKTLPMREYCAGLAEVIKAALIMDNAFFDWLEQHIDQLLEQKSAVLREAISQACAIKAAIVAEDERESGRRALLNLGHTFAHAIELALGYGEWLHGEAVAVGLVLAADFSRRLEWLSDKDVARIKNILTMAKLPIRLPHSISAAQLCDAMQRDKKKDTQAMKLILLKGIGQALVTSPIDLEILRATITENRLSISV